ncbi:hypothetical protein C0T31_03940 [Dysgonamonadaceae bacterium]|nr:hypothetical protein C0T31_03940 [Dysgonamonadaceae bacterium]
MIGPSIPSGNLTGFDRLFCRYRTKCYTFPTIRGGLVRFYRTKQYCHLLFYKEPDSGKGIAAYR